MLWGWTIPGNAKDGAETHVVARDVAWLGGWLDLEYRRTGERWELQYAARSLRAERLPGLLRPSAAGAAELAGLLWMRGWAAGEGSRVLRFAGTGSGDLLRFALPAADGAAGGWNGEGIGLDLEVEGRREADGGYRLSSRMALPVGRVWRAAGTALNLHHTPLRFEGEWAWQGRRLQLTEGRLEQRGVLRLRGGAQWDEGSGLRPDSFHAEAECIVLDRVYALYLAPFLRDGGLRQASLQGECQGSLEMRHGRLEVARIHLRKVDVADPLKKFRLRRGTVDVQWDRSGGRRRSVVHWAGGRAYHLPFGPGRLVLESGPEGLQLERPVDVPVLGGSLHLQELALRGLSRLEPALRLRGRLRGAALSSLGPLPGTGPLQGSLDGEVRSLVYDRQGLRLEAAARARLFGGTLHADSLHFADGPGQVPRLQLDLRFDGLDLAALTETLDFGRIEGGLTGRLQGLVLEDWLPVAFDLWMESDPQSRLRRRISQRALNILNEVSGVRLALPGRLLIGMFEAFDYERLGFGCRLEDGLCVLRGIEPAAKGYYLVRGRGVPRIDVLVYNQRIDWHRLWLRLRRAMAP